LIYPYEDSRVLYRGVDDFQRVKTPQPGDLAVWLGHVGIVLSPEEKTFLSSVRSGIITESWSAPHWARRGRPHFFRYRIGPSANLELLAAIMSDGPAVRNPIVQSEDTRTAGIRPPALRNEDLRNEAARNDDVQDADAPSEDARAPQAHRDVPLPRDDRPDTAAESIAGDSTAFVAVIHQRKTPGKREVVAAILESGNARAQALTAGRTLDLDHPVSVFDHVEVTRIKMKHESGSVSLGSITLASITLKLSETMSQEDGKILTARMVEREFSMVRRRDGVWVISDPRRRTYLPQAQALGVFESQAELFLRRAPNSSGTRALVKALDRLYDRLPGAQQRAAR
ncbi:MAG TPA: CHAP domain-containing protein, partial [Candidatus Angelobacter sp.]